MAAPHPYRRLSFFFLLKVIPFCLSHYVPWNNRTCFLISVRLQSWLSSWFGGHFLSFLYFLWSLTWARSSSFGGPHYPITIIGSTLLHDCKQWGICFYVSSSSSSRQGQHRKEGCPQAITKASAGPIAVMPLSWGVLPSLISHLEIFIWQKHSFRLKWTWLSKFMDEMHQHN